MTQVTPPYVGNLCISAQIPDPTIMHYYHFDKLNFTSPYFLAMDCLLNEDQAVYCSCALTSGRLRYDEMKKAGINDLSDFKHKVGSDWLQKNIVDVNMKSANTFTKKVRGRLPAGTLVLNPGPLSIPGWGQLEYLAYWEEIIRTRVKAVWFNKDWEFSDGCTLEFVVATQKDLPRFDADGNQLSAHDAAIAIENAITELEGFNTTKLHQNLERLRELMEKKSSITLSPPIGTLQTSR